MNRETYAILRKPGTASKDPFRGPMGESVDVPHYGLEAVPSTPPADIQLEIKELEGRELAELQQDKTVERIAPSMGLRLIEPVEKESAESTSTEKEAWGVREVGAIESPFTGKGITVAVLDTGIDAKHPAFSGVELIEEDFTDEGHGDSSGHGTHCAGTLFGRDVHKVRIGVATGVEIALIGKVVGESGGGTTDQVYKALRWAVDKGARIISMSLALDFTGLTESLVEEEDMPIQLATSKALAAYRENMIFFDRLVALLQARPETRPLIVAAAGNESRRHEREDFEITAGIPAAAEGVIAVGALGKDGDDLSIARFSNIGVDISGPGVRILSAKPGGGLIYKGGTSMAAPHVAGVAALWAEKQVRERGELDIKTLEAQLVGLANPTGLALNCSSQAIGSGLAKAPLH